MKEEQENKGKEKEKYLTFNYTNIMKRLLPEEMEEIMATVTPAKAYKCNISVFNKKGLILRIYPNVMRTKIVGKLMEVS